MQTSKKKNLEGMGHASQSHAPETSSWLEKEIDYSLIYFIFNLFNLISMCDNRLGPYPCQ